MFDFYLSSKDIVFFFWRIICGASGTIRHIVVDHFFTLDEIYGFTAVMATY